MTGHPPLSAPITELATSDGQSVTPVTWKITGTAEKLDIKPKREIDLQDTGGAGSIAFNQAKVLFALAAGQELRLYDPDWNLKRTIRNEFGPIYKAVFAPSKNTLRGLLLVDMAKDAADGHEQGERRFWRIYDLDEVLAGRSGTSGDGDIRSNDAATALDIARQTTSFANQAMQQHGWPLEEVPTEVQESLRKGIERSILSIAFERLVLQRQVLPGTLTEHFALDGECVFIRNGSNEYTIVDLSTREVMHTFSHPSCDPEAAARGQHVNNDNIMWIGESPNGKYIATVSWDHTAILWDASSGKQIRTLTGPTQQNCRGVFARDSSWFAVGDGNGNVFVWDTETGETIKILDVKPRWVRQMVLNTSGDRLAVGNGSGVINIYDTSDWSLKHHFHLERFPGPSFGNEIHGLQYASKLSTDEPATLVFTASIMELAPPTRGGGGRHSADAQHRVYSLTEEGEARYIVLAANPTLWRQSRRGSSEIHFSPDGKEIWSVDGDMKIRIWDRF